MASLTVRNLDPQVKERLRVRAARHGRSMEDEVRRILQDITALPEPQEDLATIAQNLFGAGHGVELELPPRAPERAPPSFE
jgi:plasmid stability protein